MNIVRWIPNPCSNTYNSCSWNLCWK